MRAARMHGYRQPLVLEDVKIPEIAADEVLLKVGAAGMCRTDAQMVDGYFEPYHPLTFPITARSRNRRHCRKDRQPRA